MLKPVFATLRLLGHTILGYIGDTILVGPTELAVEEAVRDTVSLLESLGFEINQKKSVFKPAKIVTFLGFVLNTERMTVRLTEDKRIEIRAACTRYSRRQKLTIQQLASLVGKLVATFPAARYGPLHYRDLERDKVRALQMHGGDFSKEMVLGPQAKMELDWWITNIDSTFALISRPDAGVVIQTDASGQGWGAYDGYNRIGGRWNALEMTKAETNEINFLELWAAFLALQALCGDKKDVTVHLQMDNTTAIAYINNMGGMKSTELDTLARQVWQFCIQRNIWVFATHIPGSQNVVADRLSRKFDDNIEWKLDVTVFRELCTRWGKPDIDLFATRLNTQLDRFIAWRPDPEAMAVDAFTYSWSEGFLYAFPPFCLIGACIQKIMLDRAELILIVPVWPTQPWYSQIAPMLVEPPILLPRSKNLLSNPVTGACHPLVKLTLMCCRLSAKQLRATRVEIYQQKPWTSLPRLGESRREDNTPLHIKSGLVFVNGREKIPFQQM
jgi:hypothetical protein